MIKLPSDTAKKLMEVGRNIASLWGAECTEAEVFKKRVVFHCIEHGEQFTTSVSYAELKSDYGLDIEATIERSASDASSVAPKEQLIGVVFQYGEDDYSIWTGRMSQEDQNAICSILEKYASSGISARGDGSVCVNDTL